MSPNTISRANKNIYEAFACFAEATKQVEVQVGKQGKISLQLCDNCIVKFRED
jgi:hypothetical protein